MIPLATFKSAILADNNLTATVAAQDWPGIANYYNGASATVLWRKDIPVQDFIGAFVWSEVGSFTADVTGRLNILLRADILDATNANTRAGLSAIFTNQAAPLSQAALIAIAKRLGTRFETIAAFLTLMAGTNASSQYGVTVTALDVQQAMS